MASDAPPSRVYKSRTMSVSSIDAPDDVVAAARREQVPWARVILQGQALLDSARYNKDLAFTWEERRALRLDGLLPPRVETQDQQMLRVRESLDNCATNLDKYTYLSTLQRSNKKLFYRTLKDFLVELLPIVYTPTVGEACVKYNHIYRQNAGLHISIEDRGRVGTILRNWPQPDVRCIVFTDGERILGLGDLGANGMGIPIGKLALYTACAGISPHSTLPVVLDCGTENEALLADPLYMGLRRRRARGDEYDALIEEFITEARAVFGTKVLLQFEDFANANAFRLLEKYRDRACVYNDDVQGTASVTVSALIAAEKITGRKFSENTYLFFGGGSAGLGIAELLALAIAEERGESVADARKRIHVVDSRGLITKDRPSGGVSGQKSLYAHEGTEHMGPGLVEIVRKVRPNAIVGVAAIAGAFDEEVCKAMADITERPVIFALSNPTSKSECSAEDAYRWTGGRCVFASGSPFGAVEVPGRGTQYPSQCNNSYCFPGLSMGVVASSSRRVTDRMFLISARTIASMVSDEDVKEGRCFPPFTKIRDVSRSVAIAVAQEAYDCGLATVMPQPEDMDAFVRANEWSTTYATYHFNEDGHLHGTKPESKEQEE